MDDERTADVIVFVVIILIVMGLLYAIRTSQENNFVQGVECQKAIATLQTSADTLDFYRMQSDMCIRFLEKGEL